MSFPCSADLFRRVIISAHYTNNHEHRVLLAAHETMKELAAAMCDGVTPLVAFIGIACLNAAVLVHVRLRQWRAYGAFDDLPRVNSLRTSFALPRRSPRRQT